MKPSEDLIAYITKLRAPEAVAERLFGFAVEVGLRFRIADDHRNEIDGGELKDLAFELGCLLVGGDHEHALKLEADRPEVASVASILVESLAGGDWVKTFYYHGWGKESGPKERLVGRPATDLSPALGERFLRIRTEVWPKIEPFQRWLQANRLAAPSQAITDRLR